MVLVELASERRMLGAGALPFPVLLLVAFPLLVGSFKAPTLGFPLELDAGIGTAVFGTLAVLALSLSSFSFLAALEKERARFLKKFDAPAIIPPPPLPLPLPLPLDSLLAFEESVLVLEVAWIWGGGGSGMVPDLGVLRDEDDDLEDGLGEGERRGLSGEGAFSAGVEAAEFGEVLRSADKGESVDDVLEAGEGEEAGEEDWRLDSGLYFDIVQIYFDLNILFLPVRFDVVVCMMGV
jgi:hypothetical protein